MQYNLTTGVSSLKLTSGLHLFAGSKNSRQFEVLLRKLFIVIDKNELNKKCILCSFSNYIRKGKGRLLKIKGVSRFGDLSVMITNKITYFGC